MSCGMFFPLLLILIGVWIWASNYGIRVFSFYRDWPLVFVLLGLWTLLRINRRRKRIRKE